MRGKKNNSGFTLMEILITIVIFIDALGIMYAFYFSGLDFWENAKCQADLQAQARIAMNFMVSELRNTTRTSQQDSPSPNLSIPYVPPNNKSIHFYLPQVKDGDILLTDANDDIEWDKNDAIDYEYVPEQKILKRLKKSGQKVLAENVSDVQFIDNSIDSTLPLNELNIILTLSMTTKKQRNIAITLSSIVRLRN